MRWLVALLLTAGIFLLAASIALPRPRQAAGLVIDPLRVSTGLL